MVTAGLLGALLGLELSLAMLSLLVLAVVVADPGRSATTGCWTDLMKVMVLVLGVLTLVAVAVAAAHGPAGDPGLSAPRTSGRWRA